MAADSDLGTQNDTHIYIATERVVPLTWHLRRKSLTEETIKWGLYSIAVRMAWTFWMRVWEKTDGVCRKRSTSSTRRHHRYMAQCVLRSVYTSESGEWKLGGFDVLSSMKEDDAVIYVSWNEFCNSAGTDRVQTYGSLVPDSGRYSPPEVVKTGWEAIKRNPLTAVDAYDYGILLHETFNGSFMGGDQLSAPKSIPPTMQQSYKRLIQCKPESENISSRISGAGSTYGRIF